MATLPMFYGIIIPKYKILSEKKDFIFTCKMEVSH